MTETSNPRRRRARRVAWVKRAATIAVALALVSFVGVSLFIGSGVREARDAAVGAHPGDPVDALIAYLDDPGHSLGERNRAVWALGQLGDPRALPFLETHLSGQPCDHERNLCQREVEKAVALLRGGVNLPALVWRHGSLRSGTP